MDKTLVNRFYLDKEKDIIVSIYREKEDEIRYILETPNHNTGNLITNLAKLCNVETIKDKNDNSINLFFGSFKSYGGTERIVNGIYSIEDTANIETWYRPDISSNCRIARANDGAIFDVINEPENINMRNPFLKFKVKRVKGGA